MKQKRGGQVTLRLVPATPGGPPAPPSRPPEHLLPGDEVLMELARRMARQMLAEDLEQAARTDAAKKR